MEEQNRSEEATPHKREEARKKGSVARSQDVLGAMSALTLLLVLMTMGARIAQHCLGIFSALLSHAGEWSFSQVALVAWMQDLGIELFRTLMPLWLLLLLTAAVTGAAQVGLVFSTEPLKPDWQKLNPLEGFKRLLTLRSLFEAAKSCVKFLAFSLVLYGIIRSMLPDWMLLAGAGAGRVANAIGAALLQVLRYMALAMLVVAAADWLFVRRTLNKKLKMSKREVREEYKRREGDPRIKSKLKEIRLQFLQKTRSASRVKEADVLVVNPRHLALAIQYKRGEMAAPMLLAKGAGEMALKMKETARRHGVPILVNKPLARGLFRDVDVDEWIPDDYFGPVAKALVWGFRVKKS
ncbi:EscU/YscU/HrcU family type III secretion system export apparatus switch protein [Aquitalea aquatica]|uniref:EscU/YscU/HrcU family type III secretion system export apparatus switch protein n=1 Tax=Aquitalea aquatica TaxID=3044273 RepID=A0A838Y3F8_9NEIS|nr:EscU/YscU/HrcU family type III secretion system export apparatus switch protein [Aquitalea magnusonii]MBA4707087.1 EscU/YscU/HrcU family type III secretion system export apparatus switch protein [Aquitalea magnusonii]